MFVWCVLAVLTLAPVAAGTSAGIIVRITQPALDFGRQVGVGVLEEMLKNYKVPDINNVLVEGNVTGLHFGNLTELHSELKFVPNKGIKFSVKDAKISLQGYWKSNALHDSGDFNVTVKGLKFSTITTINADDTDRPKIKHSECRLKLETLITKTTSEHRIRIRFVTLLGKTVFFMLSLRYLPKKICSMVDKYIVTTTKNLTYHATLGNYSELDFSMVGPPHISNYFDLALKGVFYKIGQHENPPFLPTDISFPPSHVQKMLYIVVSAFTVNSLSYVLHNDNVFSFDITDDMIPLGSPIRFDSTTFSAFIPEIAKQYPDQKMKLWIRTEKPPMITFDENNATVHVSINVTAYAIESNNEMSPVFDLNLEATAGVNLKVTEQKLTGAMTLITLDVNIAKSEVGEFVVKKLKTFLETVMRFFIIPIVNVHFQKGLSLPFSLVSQSLSFSFGTFEPVDTQIHIFKDYLWIETGLTFTGKPLTDEE